MGTGFVLLMWLIVWMVVALVSSAVLGLVTRWFLKRAPRGPRLRAIFAVIALPPVAVLSAFVGFVVYGVLCETVRGVDFGVGDTWRVPLGPGYRLLMIDTPEQAFIETPPGTQVGFGFRRLGYDDKAIYIETEPESFLLIDRKTGQSIGPLTLSKLEAELQRLGSPASSLHSPESVYHSIRWTYWDLLAIPLVFGPPVLLAVLVAYYVWRVRRSDRVQMSSLESA